MLWHQVSPSRLLSQCCGGIAGRDLPPNCFGQGAANVDHLKLGAPRHLVAQRDGVGNDQGREAAVVDSVDGFAAEDTVCVKFVSAAVQETTIYVARERPGTTMNQKLNGSTHE